MNSKFFAIAGMLAMLHSAAFAEQFVLNSSSVGVTTAGFDYTSGISLPAGSVYMIDTTSYFDTETITVDYSPEGDRIEKVLGYSDWQAATANFGLSSGAGGFATMITAHFHDAIGSQLANAVTLTLNIVDNSFEPKPLFDISYQIMLPDGNPTMSSLLGSSYRYLINSEDATAVANFYSLSDGTLIDTMHMASESGSIVISAVTAVPEPATYAMFAAGAFVLLGARRRKLI